MAEAIPESKHYVKILDADIEAQKEAAISGNIKRMIESVRKGARDTKKGAKTLKSNANLFKLADEEAPAGLNGLGDGFAAGTKTAKDENDMMGEFTELVETYLAEAN